MNSVSNKFTCRNAAHDTKYIEIRNFMQNVMNFSNENLHLNLQEKFLFLETGKYPD